MKKKTKLVYGAGINDSDYFVAPEVGGYQDVCPIYQTWKSMICRCYCKKHQARYQSYLNCSVDAEWLTFSNFRDWMISQDWKGKELDKDILKVGNKVYSKENCVFVCKTTNNFISNQLTTRDALPVGVCLHRQSGKFQAQCSDPFTKKRGHIGLFDCPIEAHLAWKSRKHQIACQLAELQTDLRVAEALRTRYL